MAMSKRVAELEELAIHYKKTKCQDAFNQIYYRFKKLMEDTAENNEQLSDYHWALYKAIEDWNPDRNVWFIYYLKTVFNNLKKTHLHEKMNKKANFFNNMIDIYSTVSSDSESKMRYVDIIPDPKQEEIQSDDKKKRQKVLQFFKRYYIPKRDQQLLKMMYEGKTQMEIAKTFGVSQSMVHKLIKNVAKSKYASKLYKTLKEDVY